MRERFQLPFPFWRVQFDLFGGNRRMTGVAIIYAALVLVGCVGWRRFFSQDPISIVLDELISAVTAVQAFILYLGGCSAVHRAMLRDFNTKMMESHRLSPVSGSTVALGFLFGAPLQILLLASINLLLGVLLTLMAGGGTAAWLYGNALMFVGAINIWAIAVCAGMNPSKPINPIPIIIGAAIFLNASFVVVPGVGLFSGAYPLFVGYSLAMGGGLTSGVGMMALGGLTLLLIMFWVSTAAAKFRRPDLPALNAKRGMILLLLWILLGFGGMVVASRIAARGTMGSPFDDGIIEPVWIGTLAGSLILGALVLCGATHCRLLVARGAMPRDRFDRMSPWIVCIIAAVLMTGIPAAIGYDIWWDLLPRLDRHVPPTNLDAVIAWSICFATYLLAMLCVRATFIIAFAWMKRPVMATAVVLIIACVIPPLVSYIHGEAVREYEEPLVFSWIIASTPPGTLLALWQNMSVPLWPGLVIQAVVAIGLSLLAHRVVHRPQEITVDQTPVAPSLPQTGGPSL